MSKYGSVQTTHPDGTVSASKKEARRYEELKMLADSGFITELRKQRSYELIPKQEGERACVYFADFVYRDMPANDTATLHVEDTKGFRTKDYIIKRKLMLRVHGIRIEEL